MSRARRRELDRIRADVRKVTRERRQRQTSGLNLPSNIIDWALTPEGLGKDFIYPRQGTLLKLATLRVDLMTDYDFEVLEEWGARFVLDEEARRYVGHDGVPPDVLQRIEASVATGRQWMRQIVFVGGRRSGKGWLGSVLASYVLAHYAQLASVHEKFGIDRNKRLMTMVIGTKRDQAERDQFGDLVDAIEDSGAFRGLIGKRDKKLWTLFSPADLRTTREGRKPRPSFGISPFEFTGRAPRGLAGNILMFDEMAHVDAGLSASADDVFSAALPALTQCRGWELIYLASSPWAEFGRFHEEYVRGLQVNEDGTPTYFDTLVVHLASADMYLDSERTGPDGDLVLYPGGPKFPQITGRPIAADDDEARLRKQANPWRYRVEEEAHWMSGQDAFFDRDAVNDTFKPWGGREIAIQSAGVMQYDYFAHGDPAKSRCNFGWAICHVEWVDGIPHVIHDVLREWRPTDFPGNVVDFTEIEDEIKGYLKVFRPVQVTFDQFNFEGSIQRLSRFAQELGLHTQVFERTATRELNIRTAETVRNAMNDRRIHAPHHPLTKLELMFLQFDGNKLTAPTAGEIQTKDCADAFMAATYEALQATVAGTIQQQFRAVGLRGSAQGGLPLAHQQLSRATAEIAAAARLRRAGIRRYRGRY